MPRQKGSKNKTSASKEVKAAPLDSQYETVQDKETYANEKNILEYKEWLQTSLMLAQIRAANITAGGDFKNNNDLYEDDDETTAINDAHKKMSALKKASKTKADSAEYWKWQSLVNKFGSNNPRTVAYYAVKTDEQFAKSEDTKSLVKAITDKKPGGAVPKVRATD